MNRLRVTAQGRERFFEAGPGTVVSLLLRDVSAKSPIVGMVYERSPAFIIYICVYIRRCVCTYIHVYTYIYIYIHTYVYTCLSLSLSIYIYI